MIKKKKRKGSIEVQKVRLGLLFGDHSPKYGSRNLYINNTETDTEKGMVVFSPFPYIIPKHLLLYIINKQSKEQQQSLRKKERKGKQRNGRSSKQRASTI